MTSIEVRDQGQWEGLQRRFSHTQRPARKTLQVLLGDNFVNQQPAFAFLASSITLEELQAAADELQRVC